ncbi:MAG: hypothetical protein GYB20_04265 [Oceanospirillales bacterium]|nr:hypothetical protein [Oceanospirillales bacterium]MBR9886895.1 hypothetical protein [Oceanospirillales bacterium]
MKLSQVLSQINQVERSKFVSCLDKVRTEAIKTDSDLEHQLTTEGQLKSASGSEITELFKVVANHFCDYIREQIALGGPQISLLINILSRDGNSIARQSWIESLYVEEHGRLSELAIDISKEIEEAETADGYNRGQRFSIYRDCFKIAYENDLRLNREAKVTDDERTILNVLSDRLGMSKDEAFAIEHIQVPVPISNIQEALSSLRELGVIFIDKRKSEVLVADEIVELLRVIQNKVIADKYTTRVLRSLSDAELSVILRKHGEKSRGTSRQDKIKWISHSGVSIKNILARDIFTDEKISERKDRIKILIEDLNLSVDKLGAKLDERINLLISAFKNNSDAEFNLLSASGFSELITALKETKPSALERIREEFEIESTESLDPERLRSLGVSPLDILYLYSNDEVRAIRDSMGLSKRGNARVVILESYASANDKLIEHYELLASRDLAGLSLVNIDIKEAELGLKFEEVTRTMFEILGLVVDEELRKQINTAKDRADIIVSLGGDDVIVCEVKSHKNGDFSKYSTTSRQVKAYVNRCESNGKRVAQVLIVAPSFSDDFVLAAELDTDVNISLLEAKGLKAIVTAYKAKRHPNFSEKLLTKGGLLKADLIAKTI